MSLSLALFILGVIFVVGWFALGTQYNIRKGHDAMRWLQDGLPVVGEKTNLRWLGSSVVELKIQSAKPPFRSVTVLVVLEPRDVAPLWALARLRGRRDLFIFRGVLQKLPRTELEAFDPSSWSARGVARQIKADQWTQLSADGGTGVSPVQPGGDTRLSTPPLVVYLPPLSRAASDLVKAATLDACPLVRLAIHRGEPHLEVHWRFDSLRRHSAGEVFETLRRLAQRT